MLNLQRKQKTLGMYARDETKNTCVANHLRKKAVRVKHEGCTDITLQVATHTKQSDGVRTTNVNMTGAALKVGHN